MTLNKFAIVFVCIFIILFTVLLINNQVENNAHEVEKQYSHHIEAACEAAMQTVYPNGNQLFSSLDTRLIATEAFFNALNTSMNRKGDYTYETKLYVPFICYVDYDGYYICYNAGLDDNASTSNLVSDINEHTPLIMWTETTTNYTIRYYLTDEVTVTSNATGESFKGTPSDVYNHFGDIELDFLLAPAEEMESRKTFLIVDDIKEAIEYYLNTQNNYTNSSFVQYNIDMSYAEQTSWARLLKNPCVISFLQGKQMNVRETELINIYGYSGQELISAVIKDTVNNTVR